MINRFNISKYLKEEYNIKNYPFASNASLPLSVEKLEALLENVHEHYENQIPTKEFKPELVTDEYSFNKQNELAELVNLKTEIDELGVVLKGFSKLIGSKNYILSYIDRNGVACYSIGDGMPMKDVLYLQYLLGVQVSLYFQRSGVTEGN